MKKFFWLTVIAGSFFIFHFTPVLADTCTTSPSTGAVKINEYSSFTTSSDWVEIYNLFDQCIDIGGWQVWDSTVIKPVTIVSSSIIINSHDWFVIDLNDRLNEKADKIILKDLNGNIQDQLEYGVGKELDSENNDWFWARFPDGGDFVKTPSSTPGAANIFLNSSTTSTEINILSATSTDWSSIKLNEIVSDPATGTEWVELFNSSTSSFDLAGGYICDSKSFTNSECKNITGVVDPLGWLLVSWPGYYLNNASDTVYLRDNGFNIIDELWYGTANLDAPDKGQSLARRIDGSDTDNDNDWTITTKITQNSMNEIVLPPTQQVGSGGGGSNSMENSYNMDKTTKASSTLSAKNNKNTTSNNKAEIKDSVKPVWKIKSPYSLAPNEEGIFSVAGTVDPRGGVLAIVWDFGDGATSSGWIVGHSFATSGVYLVSVSASSTTGTKGGKQAEVLIGPEFSIARSQVKFAEVLAKAENIESEFFELENLSVSSQNISGWKIKNNAGKDFEIPPNTIIYGSSTLKFFRGATHLDFNNNGDEIKLFSPNNILLDSKTVNQKEEDKIKNIKKTTIKKIVSYGPTINSIGDVLAGVKGQKVKIKGVVAVLPGVFGKQYFYIFDGQNGAQIYNYKKDFPQLALGDLVEVNGAVSIYGTIKRVNIKNKNDVDILATGQTLVPLEVKLEEISDEILGAIVSVTGDITEMKTNYMYLDDGAGEIQVYFKQGTKIEKQNIKEGNKVRVIGVLERSKSGLQIWPRSVDDIITIGYSDEFLNKKQLSDQQSRSSTDKYVTATAGGLTALLLGFVAKSRGQIFIGIGKKAVSLVSGFIKRG